MKRRSTFRVLGAVWLLVGCGASTSAQPALTAKSEHEKAHQPGPVIAAAPAESALPSSPSEATTDGGAVTTAELQGGSSIAAVPTTCVGGGKRCVPPPAFSRQLCRGRFPSLALLLFEKHAPWEHLYVRAEELDPINSYGGPRSDAQLAFGEEVVLLKPVEHGTRGGMSVSGASDVDILRLDGTCATIREEMLVRYVPGSVKSAPVIWKFLDDGIQRALLADRRVERAQKIERQGCRGVSVNQRNEECARASQALNDAILVALRKGIALPAPDKIPRWSE